ncbi:MULTISPECIES: DUF4389 domain-containing protein [Roseobacteraceae]|uniref:DUF4389 domain-containing protein n=1 Tax=Roseobacteraceae TaxID=2854170 RepID=UPI00125FE37D|nr:MULTISPECIES: DUF4389 domain-containing protein [Roseobacteraceae]KAB6717831.1 DUF4389 domain-containing protein [Roseobacter sp. TSBP12]|tara:strand:+ start:2287 stop:2604 length:318 start_codon:yes stop_codon:yes gene_type:complete
MADPHEFDHVMPNMSSSAPKRLEEVQENIGARILFSVLIWMMMSFASTIIGFLAVLQAIVLLTTGKKPNARIAGFGTDVGIWFAKATRYITADSEEKPWPWSELD